MSSSGILVITQVMDERHPVLGFFVGWVREWRRAFSSLQVVALQTDPILGVEDVNIYSLGKERGSGRGSRILRLWYALWIYRKRYTTVFVHMNEEYVLLCGLFWRMTGKRIILWRNHPVGTWKTPIAAFLSDELMYTSPQSYVARYKRSQQMPAGIRYAETCFYDGKEGGLIILAGRVAEWYKRTHILVEAAILLYESGCSSPWRVWVIGDPDRGEEKYYEGLKKRISENGLDHRVQFSPGISHEEVLDVYARADIVINTTRSGSFDKALLEAMSNDCVPITSNVALRDVLPLPCQVEDGSVEALHAALKYILELSAGEKNIYRDQVRRYIGEQHSLNALTHQLKYSVASLSRK